MAQKPTYDELKQRVEELEAERDISSGLLESTEQIDNIIRKSIDLDQMMTDVLEIALALFGCDRAWLMFPGDPNTPHWSVPMERTTPRYPGAAAIGPEIKTTSAMALQFKTALESEGPLVFDPQTKLELPDAARQSATQSAIVMAIRPKTGKPWLLGLSQCSRPRIWTKSEQRLFKKIGIKITDTLSNLIFFRNLLESEERFRAIFEQAAVGVAQIASKTGDFVRINQRYADIVGYTVEELERLTFQKITHPDDLQEDLDNMQRLMDGEFREFSMQKRYRHKNGSTVWVNLTVSPMWRIGEEPNYHVAVVEDITKSKQAEESRLFLEQKLALHFLQTPLGVIEWDFDFNVRSWNPAAEKIFGYAAEEIIGKHGSIIIPENYKPHTDRIWAALIQQKGGTRSTNENITKRGETLFCQWFNTPIIDKMGNTVAVFSLVQDVTKRRQTEQALQQSEAKFRGLVEVTSDWIWEVNAEGTYSYASPKVETMLGYRPDEVVGKTPFDLMPPKEAERVGEIFKDLVDNGSPIVGLENVNLHKNGRRVVLETSGVPFFDENGKLTGYRGIDRDVTESKQAEEEKRKALEFAAEQSKNALIGQVAGKMAHDFNNILMAIMGNAQLASIYCTDEKTKEKLERINEFSERGRDITHNLISFSKDQAPKQTHFKIEDKIELVLKILERDLTGIRISRNYKSGLPELLADPGMIQDVLVNLIQNSIHAMSKVKDPKLKLEAYSQRDKVYVVVEDNGCGIPEKHQDSIYTPSFTLKGSHDETGSYKPEIKGTGYGMANVKKYVIEKHKGDISLESVVGKGTKITIGLRIIKDHLSSEEKKEFVKGQIYAERKILLVEDEHAIADVQYQILTQEPFSHIVLTAVNGQMAIDLFNRNKFDFVSLDYMLPGKINGLDVYYHIRENDKAIPIMLISGNIEFLESMEKLKQKDPNLDHLSKPVNNLDYVNKINELIGKSLKNSRS